MYLFPVSTLGAFLFLNLSEPWRNGKKTGLNATFKILIKEEMLTRTASRYSGKLAITTFFYTSKGEVVSQHWDEIEMNLKPNTVAYVGREGYEFSRLFMLPTKENKLQMKAIVYNPTSDRLGSKYAKTF